MIEMKIIGESLGDIRNEMTKMLMALDNEPTLELKTKKKKTTAHVRKLLRLNAHSKLGASSKKKKKVEAKVEEKVEAKVEEKVEAKVEAKVEEKEIPLRDQVLACLQEVNSKLGLVEAKKILNSFNAHRFSEIDSACFSDFISACKEALNA